MNKLITADFGHYCFETKKKILSTHRKSTTTRQVGPAAAPFHTFCGMSKGPSAQVTPSSKSVSWSPQHIGFVFLIKHKHHFTLQK